MKLNHIKKNVNVLIFFVIGPFTCSWFEGCIYILQSLLPYKAVIGCVPLYALFRIMQKMLPGLIQNSVGASLPFACASNSLNKPTPLNLDLSIPSLRDIKWSTSRFIYLFNIQLEKNIGTYVLNPPYILYQHATRFSSVFYYSL